eukprot:10948907-Ditylum_brightwellii.AAC.1
MQKARSEAWEIFEELQKQKDIIAQKYGGPNVGYDNYIEINVGGRIISTTHSTLAQQKGTMLEALFSGYC